MNLKNSIFLRTLLIATMLLLVSACGRSSNNGDTAYNPNEKDPYFQYTEGIVRSSEDNSLAVMETDKGIIVFELYDLLTPKTVENFKMLANQGFYNGLDFHLVQTGFVVQTGDPTGTGVGGSETPPIPLEIHPDLRHNARGIVGMAHVDAEKDSATSQFYITLEPYEDLDDIYAVFGKVLSGLDVLDELRVNDIINVIRVFDADTL